MKDGLKILARILGPLGIFFLILDIISIDNIEVNRLSFGKLLFYVFALILIGIELKRLYDKIRINEYKAKIDYNNMPKDFLDFYNKINYEKKESMQKRKRSVIKWLVFSGVTYAVCITLLILFIFVIANNITTTYNFIPIIVFIMVVAFFVLLYKIHNYTKEKILSYKRVYKGVVLPKLVMAVDNSFEYEFSDSFKDEEYKFSGLEVDEYNSYDEEDYVIGLENKLYMYEVNIRNIYRRK